MFPMFGKKKKDEDREMTFLEHLEELRWHIIRSVVAIVFFAVLAFIYKRVIFDDIILAPNGPGFITNRLLCRLAEMINSPSLCINQKPIDLISIKMSGQFTTHINISLIAGVILAFPYVFWEFWKFFRPALYDKERKHARGAVLSASFLFMLGVVFGYFVIVPLSLNFLGTYSVSDLVHNQINVRSYIGTISSIVLASGLSFELPVVAYFLARIGIITPKFMRQYRKHSIVVILIIAAIITPPDVFSQTLVAIPLLLLYEISILIVAGVVRKREKEKEARQGTT
jgi:sec-independent protein translocase protein TatC